MSKIPSLSPPPLLAVVSCLGYRLLPLSLASIDAPWLYAATQSRSKNAHRREGESLQPSRYKATTLFLLYANHTGTLMHSPPKFRVLSVVSPLASCRQQQRLIYSDASSTTSVQISPHLDDCRITFLPKAISVVHTDFFRVGQNSPQKASIYSCDDAACSSEWQSVDQQS
ncbi:hypothetical protein C8Q72DRAFT_826172 [Fomitopsis betulina]|nr:hypothetical protein C8Q72DRAFT_826172 [Fomitopsis betulina]